MLFLGNGAVAPHRREGLQEQVQAGGSRQIWLHTTCTSGAARCPIRRPMSLQGGKWRVVVVVFCSLLQAYE